MSKHMSRIAKELESMKNGPPPGIQFWPSENQLDKLEGRIIGAEGTPYARGVFKLDIQIPERYPFEPPLVKFVTPIYHPNIDGAGRICLDIFKLPPQGSWKPCLNIANVLLSIQLLMSEPNLKDPLEASIAEVYRQNKGVFEAKARSMTAAHAMEDTIKPVIKKQSPDKMQVDGDKSASVTKEATEPKEESETTENQDEAQGDQTTGVKRKPEDEISPNPKAQKI